MADNYLEKRFDEVFGDGARRKVVVRRGNPSLDTLFHHNRSYRGYDQSVSVSEQTLREIVQVNTLVASSRNRQVLRFKLVSSAFSPEGSVQTILKNIVLGGALPQLHLPFPGTEPQAFIIICAAVDPSTILTDNSLYIDLGISMQSMLLKAVDMGLNGIIIRSFNREAIVDAFSLPFPPLALLAIGKGNENIFLTSISPEEDHTYYRKDGNQYVPKVRLDDLIIGD